MHVRVPNEGREHLQLDCLSNIAHHNIQKVDDHVVHLHDVQ
jgi:hypothetical protein